VLSLVLPAALAEESAKTGITAMASAEGNYTIKDFHFADGETFPQLRIYYRTLGKPVSYSGHPKRGSFAPWYQRQLGMPSWPKVFAPPGSDLAKRSM